MLSVINNAYLRKAQQHPSYSFMHQKLLFILLTEKKYYTKDELLCISNHNFSKLEKTIKDLEEIGLVKQEGWLVKISGEEELQQKICEEIITNKKR
ncbi:MAG: hypothetical protein WC108_04540 [Bacteroidales bacterium]|jgi:predicted transcriptional regulator|nr:hypothetical protein [Candidatus ainarchaeum sp.]HPM86143.1 hypothetical protein [archaeon]